MGTKYTSQTATGYNASPPSDDGTAVSSNEVKWSFIKEKLADSVKDLADNINTELLTALDQKAIDKAIAFTTTAAGHNQTINVTAGATQSLGDASTMGTGYIVTIKNSHTAAITVDLATGADTLDGTAAGSVSLTPDAAMTFVTTAGADGYKIQSLALGDDWTVPNDLTVTGDLTLDSTVQPKIKIIDIGDWDMNGTTNVNIAHGLTLANIRDVSVMIRDDFDLNYYPLDYQGGTVGGYWLTGGTNVSLTRVISGHFDNGTYDSTTYNRGWITITYV